MADAVISVVVERIAALMEEQIRNEINLVRGVEKEVISLSDELKTIANVLGDAERRRFKEESVKAWLKKLEDMASQMDDVLDEWNYAIVKDKIEHHQSNQKVRSWIPSSSCLCFKTVAVRRDIAVKIRSVKERLDLVLKEKDRYNFVMSQPSVEHSLPESWRQSTSSVELGKVQGRDRDRDHIVSKLSEDSFILAIVGVGGLGKTTLAQLVFNDNQVEKSFDLKIWVCVSDPFDLTLIAKGIIENENAKGGNFPDTNILETLLQRVRKIVSGKKFLLVLDDVWTEEYAKWEPLERNLKFGAQGSKILVTTRNERVAKVMGAVDSNIYRPQLLSDEECWSLMQNISLSGRSEEECRKFEDVGKQIAIKCKGLPLAGKCLGSLLQFKNSLEEWENVLHSEIWQLEKAKVDLFPHLLLSYNELSPALKRCFSYCAIFPKDETIVAQILVGKWMALGYLGSNKQTMELKGWEYIQMLAARCLFQDIDVNLNTDEHIVSSFRMHDIVHDFASFVRKDGRVDANELVKKTSCQFCTPSSISNVKVYHSLLYLNKEEGPSDFCDCLASVRVLDLAFAKLHNFPRRMEKLIHLRWLNLNSHPCSVEDVKTICLLYNLKDLSLSNCRLEEIPGEIGNLIHLKHLNLSRNSGVKELPESICDLHELQSFDISCLRGICGLPEGIQRLINLQTLNITVCYELCSLPEGFYKLVNLKRLYFASSGIKIFHRGISNLTSLRTLNGGTFRVGSGWNKMGWLKNLNRLSGSLLLDITLPDDDGSTDVVEDAREAELHKKMHIQYLKIVLCDKDKKEESPGTGMMRVLDALQPHPNLQNLEIEDYACSKFPDWVTSPRNRLRGIGLHRLHHFTSFPPLWKLQCLERVKISDVPGLQFVGRDFLGTDIGFPKLKELKFERCFNWKEWEDITVEEEEEESMKFMPCLTMLVINDCYSLTAVPHRLLRKATSLEVINICGRSEGLDKYMNKDGSAWRSFSKHNPRLQFFL